MKHLNIIKKEKCLRFRKIVQLSIVQLCFRNYIMLFICHLDIKLSITIEKQYRLMQTYFLLLILQN